MRAEVSRQQQGEKQGRVCHPARSLAEGRKARIDIVLTSFNTSHMVVLGTALMKQEECTLRKPGLCKGRAQLG